MTIQKTAILISNGLTVATILLSLSVVVLWHSSAIQALRTRLTISEHWFIFGVYIGFLGSTLDNMYWLVPWSAVYLSVAESKTLVEYGVFFNIPFRQILGGLAAYCHIRSALSYRNDGDGVTKAKIILIVSLLAGLSYSLSLFLLL